MCNQNANLGRTGSFILYMKLAHHSLSFGLCGRDEGGMIWENGIETCKLHVERIASPGSMHDTVCSGLVHWDDPEGWDGEGDGRGFRTRNTYKPVVDSCQCMAKMTTIL